MAFVVAIRLGVVDVVVCALSVFLVVRSGFTGVFCARWDKQS